MDSLCGADANYAARLARDAQRVGAERRAQRVRLVRRRFLVKLLEPDRITSADRTPAQDGGISTDVGLIVLGRRTQDTWIPG